MINLLLLHEVRTIIANFIMGKKHIRATRQSGRLQSVTLCISTAMVLVLLGLIVFSTLTGRNLAAHFKENLEVTMLMDQDMSDAEAQTVYKSLLHKPYIRSIQFISKQQALAEATRTMGISLLVLAALLTFISFSLINNTVRLSIFARRFSIHTMKLVGASWSFIRAPFIRRAVVTGMLAALIACGVLAAGLYALYCNQPEILTIVTWREMAVTAGSVFLFGIVITGICANISVNKFLRMKAGELYQI